MRHALSRVLPFALVCALALGGCVSGSDRTTGFANGYRLSGYADGYVVRAGGVRYLCRGQKSRGTRRLLEDTLADSVARTGRVNVPIKASEAGFVCSRG